MYNNIFMFMKNFVTCSEHIQSGKMIVFHKIHVSSIYFKINNSSNNQFNLRSRFVGFTPIPRNTLAMQNIKSRVVQHLLRFAVFVLDLHFYHEIRIVPLRH